MASCPFCAVVDGSQPAAVVLDDAVVVAFLDHRPVFKGHVLVVPKGHVATLADLPVDAVGPFFERVQRIAAAVQDGLAADGSFVALNNVEAMTPPERVVSGEGIGGSGLALVCPAARIREFTFSSSSDAV